MKSHHFPAQKFVLINTLVTRALKGSDKEHIEQEINHLTTAFKENGYKENHIKNIMMKARRTDRKQGTVSQDKKRISLPYIKELSKRLERILRKGEINVAFCPINTIRQMVDKGKDPIDPSSYKGVYRIPCSSEMM